MNGRRFSGALIFDVIKNNCFNCTKLEVVSLENFSKVYAVDQQKKRPPNKTRRSHEILQ